MVDRSKVGDVEGGCGECVTELVVVGKRLDYLGDDLDVLIRKLEGHDDLLMEYRGDLIALQRDYRALCGEVHRLENDLSEDIGETRRDQRAFEDSFDSWIRALSVAVVAAIVAFVLSFFHL